jgi:dTDP-4-dehydrorhamnose 3,5-epimerase
MLFTETKLSGAFIIELERMHDARGFFARSWSQREWEAQQLNPRLLECNISFNQKKGTLRGMHYQDPPDAQTKLVRCTAGAVYDVIIDMRADSPTFKQWFAVELTAENHRMLYIPEGLAHGFQTLAEDTEVFYQMSAYYVPASARGVRWNDPAFGIEWPLEVEVIAPRDAAYGDIDEH